MCEVLLEWRQCLRASSKLERTRKKAIWKTELKIERLLQMSAHGLPAMAKYLVRLDSKDLVEIRDIWFAPTVEIAERERERESE